MNEENENQPAPLETESASPEQRHHRPRRRFPRRRYRGDRFRRDNSEESPNSSSATPITLAEMSRSRLSISPPAGREAARALAKPASRFRPNRNSAKGSLKFQAKALDFCAIRNAISCRRRRISLSLPEIVRRFALRDGMWINGETRRGNRGPQLIEAADDQWRRADQISGASPV